VIATCQPGDIISIQLPGHPGNATIARVTVHTPRPVAATASAGMRWPSALVKFQEGACGAERIGFYAMHALPEPCRTEGYQKVRTCGYVAG
jgi:hypothetical protein